MPDTNNPYAAAVAATRMPMIITDPHQPDNPIIYVNDAFLKLTGYGRDELLGKNCRFLQGSGTNREDVAKIRQAIANLESIEIDLLNYRKDGSSFWNRLLVSPVFGKDGKLTHFFASQFDVSPDRNRLTELSRAQSELETQIATRMQDLTLTEARLRFILGAASMGTWTLDVATNDLIVSKACRENYGITLTEKFGTAELMTIIAPEDKERLLAAIERTAATKEDLQVEYQVITPAGERRWVEIRGYVTPNVDGKNDLIVGVSQNITERKEAEWHRKVLARELMHRVKNSLATAQAVFNHSLRGATDLEDARRKVAGRIKAMSAAQEMLTQDNWSSMALDEVVKTALKAFRAYKFRINGPRIMLNERGVSALTLALYELATNSLKYGALSVEGGAVEIVWKITGLAQDRFQFNWRESGGPQVVEPSRRGFGSAIIEQITPTDMGGTATLVYDQTGLVYALEAPLKIEDGDALGATAPDA
ncbi:PAS domain-containing protein [Cereibacter sp. SYSU M97828]|nr:PAS domain-containing protein [Cereibacter flavus]